MNANLSKHFNCECQKMVAPHGSDRQLRLYIYVYIIYIYINVRYNLGMTPKPLPPLPEAAPAFLLGPAELRET